MTEMTDNIIHLVFMENYSRFINGKRWMRIWKAGGSELRYILVGNKH